jgi:uncharacterized protein
MEKIKLEDKETFQEFFSSVKEPLADTTFVMRYIWAGPLKHTWKIINGNLCVFGFLKDKCVVWGPPVGKNEKVNKLKETFSECFEIVEKINKQNGIDERPRAIYIPQCMKEDYESLANENGYAFDYWTQDYIYNTKDMAELVGSQFDSKRNRANYFSKNYNYEVKKFNPEKHSEGCLQLLELWKKQKELVVDEDCKYELDEETEVARATIKFAKKLNIKGVVLKVDGVIVGVSLGEQLTKNMMSNIIEKTNPAINGASQFIFREFARRWSDSEFLNAQDDFGIEYLKKTKLSYKPIKLIKSYYLEKK